jgi:hypothetical protein
MPKHRGHATTASGDPQWPQARSDGTCAAPHRGQASVRAAGGGAGDVNSRPQRQRIRVPAGRPETS